MFKKLKEEWKYLLVLFLIISFIALIYYLPALISKSAYLLGSDMRMQWYEFFYEFKRLIKEFIKEGKLPFYSWTLFLGNNFYASKGYYLMGDIYSYIGLFLSDNFFVMAEQLSYLKMVVSGLTFYIYLTSLNRKPISKIICSTAYVFSAYTIFFSEQLVFQSFYSFIPLYLTGIELYLKDNKKLLFTLSCGLLFATNFYLFYTLAAVSPIYFTYRYFYLEKDKKGFIKSALVLIIFFILGSFITSFIWLPTIIYVLQGNRVRTDTTLLHPIVVYPDFILSFFAPSYQYINRVNLFETWTYYNREIHTWCSTILVILIPQFTKLYSKVQKRLTIGLYCTFGVIAFFPLFCKILHAFSDPSFRWVFILIIINLSIISSVLDNINKIDFKLLRKTIIFIIILIIGSFIFGYCYSWEELSSYKFHIILFAINIGIMILSYFLYKARNLKIVLAAIILEISLNNIYFTNYFVKNGQIVTNEYYYRSIIQSYYGETTDYLKSLDEKEEFYRIYVDQDGVYGSISYNLNTLYNIKGVTTYDSTLAPSFKKMNQLLTDKFEVRGLDWMVNISDYSLLTFFNTKYAVTNKDYEIDLNNWELVDDNYFYGFCIYKNKKYIEFGQTYDKAITYDEFVNSYYSTDNLLNYVIADNNEDYELINNYVSNANTETNYAIYSGNLMEYKYTSDADSFMVISIPYDEGWSIYVDGEKINYYEVNLGFIGMPVKFGTHEVSMYFIPSGLKEGTVMSGISLIACIGYFIFDMKKRGRLVSKNI